MSGQYREDLAKEIRAELGEFDDPRQPVLWVIRDLVSMARSARDAAIEECAEAIEGSLKERQPTAFYADVVRNLKRCLPQKD